MSPLRGLSAFAESERDVLFGRDREREELARLVTSEGFRAGLLYGEPGVGKTSLLRAGLVPHLRDHGVITVVCEDVAHPIESLAHGVAQTTGVAPADDERPIAFLARVVGQAMAGQLYVFILDHVEWVLGDERICGELGDLFARVVTRSGGRARFLFCAASPELHRFGTLEKRTGSLFPPSSRYELQRFPLAEAAAVLDRTLSLAGVAADPQLAHGLAGALAGGGGVLPAELQIAALALRELGLDSPDALARTGGAGELERRWLTTCCAATGNERSALRLLAEMGTAPQAPEMIAARASLDPTFTYHALSTLQQKGVVEAAGYPGSDQTHYALSHDLLVPRIREVAAPARAAARRAFELLGSKAETGKRLSMRELFALRRERISPATPAEQRVIARSKRFYLMVAGAVAAAPLVLLIIVYVSMSGRYYLDVAAPGGGPDRVVVRAGSPGLSAFHWLPASPGFGDVVADTGFTREMVDSQAWKSIAARDLTGDRDGDAYVQHSMGALRPDLANLIDYAATGSERALDKLRSAADTPEAMVALLEALEPIARGGPHETSLIQSALEDPSPAVQTAALDVAASAARRREGIYQDTLAAALTSSSDELRRLAFSAVRALGGEQARQLFQTALAASPEADARRELLTEVTSAQTAEQPSADSAVSVLANRDIDAGTRAKARELLRRAFASDPAEAAAAAARLAADDKAGPKDRILAMELLREFAPDDSYESIARSIKEALDAKAEAVQAAALPLYARIAPQKAAGELAVMIDRKLEPAMRTATALAWGEVARATKDKAAFTALEKLLEDGSPKVRAAAARAYGNLGRPAQDELAKMVKKERFDVAVGAAYGLVNSVEVGGRTWAAVSGIREMWKKKGTPKREATKVFARLARTQPATAYTYLSSAARDKKDPALHPLGVEGLCNGMAAGHKNSRLALSRASRDDSVQVRRLVIQCVVDNPKYEATAVSVARAMVGDSDPDIRAEAARLLARAASGGKSGKEVAAALARLATDEVRDVRVIAIGALADLGDAAPAEAAPALTAAFDKADETEKLAIMKTARAVGAGELVAMAISDDSSLVRIAGIDTAIALSTGVTPAINAALTDADPKVRRAALERLASKREQLERDSIFKGLTLATRDPDPTISELALMTMARTGDEERVGRRLGADLGARSEHIRARAAAAARGMVEHNPELVVSLLEPLLADPSHDVRRAMLPSLAAAYAAINSPEQLAQMLRGAERHATARLVATGAFLMLARTEAGRDAALETLEDLADSGPPLVRLYAGMAHGMLGAGADGIAFLPLLLP